HVMAGRVERLSLLIWGASSPIFKKILFPPDPSQRVGRNSGSVFRQFSEPVGAIRCAIAPCGFAAVCKPLGLEAGTSRLHQGFVNVPLQKYFRSRLTQTTSISLAIPSH